MMNKFVKSFLLCAFLFNATLVLADHRHGDLDGLDELFNAANSLRNRLDDLERNGVRDAYELRNIKQDLQSANQNVSYAISNLRLAPREVVYPVNQTQGPYAPSCNGNPAFPAPDSRCCGFGPQALCFSYTVGCGPNETFVRAEVTCQGYVANSFALDVGSVGNQARQLACQKLDGRVGNVSLVGSVVCRPNHHR